MNLNDSAVKLWVGTLQSQKSPETRAKSATAMLERLSAAQREVAKVRNRAIADLIAAGQSTRYIAEALGVSRWVAYRHICDVKAAQREAAEAAAAASVTAVA